MSKKGVEEAQDRAWDELASLDPDDVCRRTGATRNVDSGTFTCLCLGQEVIVDPGTRTLSCESETGQILLNRLGYFTQIAILQYLVHADKAFLSGTMVSPTTLASGQLYFRGSHVLPTAQLAEAYSGQGERFVERCKALGAEMLEYGDAGAKLFPLPHLPMTVILWHGDDEFEARVNVLLDARSEDQVPPDIVWSSAMLTLLMFLM